MQKHECDKNVISHALLAFPSISACAKNKIFKLYIDVLLNVSCKIRKIKLNYAKTGQILPSKRYFE